MVEPLRIVTFKWGSKYRAEHVRRLENMLTRNLTIPFEFVLITDKPDDDADLAERVIPLWQDMQDAKLCGVRLRAFGPDMAELIGPRFAWIDLDVVITANVDHIFGRTEPFIALSTPRPPMPYNGSLVMMDAGAREEVYSRWNMQDYWTEGERLGRENGVKAGTVSDEGWMWHVLGTEEPVFNGKGWEGREDGIYYFRHDLKQGVKPLPEGACMVIMNGRAFDPSLPRWQSRCPWIKEHWR